VYAKMQINTAIKENIIAIKKKLNSVSTRPAWCLVAAN
jgi:hypothetical protein